MKKILTTLVALSLVFFAVPAMGSGECNGPGCLQTVDIYVQANPFESDFQTFSTPNSYGEAGGMAQGHIGINAYAQGTEAAFTGYTPCEDCGDLSATGTAAHDSGAFEIKDPGNFIVSGIGAYSALTMDASGRVVGLDDYAYGPDYARIDIDAQGYVHQATFGVTEVGLNYYAGNQWSEAGFNGTDYDESYGNDFSYPNWDYGYYRDRYGRLRYGWHIDSWTHVNTPTVASDHAGADALVAGGTIGGLQKIPNGVQGGVITANFATWNTRSMPFRSGFVAGSGDAQLQVVHQDQGSWGAVNGISTFCYEGYKRGAGIAGVKGKVIITNTPNSSTVTSTGSAFSAAGTDGGNMPD